MVRRILLVVGALAACPVGQAWGEDEAAPMARAGLIEAPVVGHLYINLATGERAWIGGETRNDSFLIWDNMQDPNGVFYNMGPQLGNDPNLTDELLDWGDIELNSEVDCFRFQYGTSVPDPGANGVPGYNLIVSFYDVESGNGDPDVTPIQRVVVPQLPGADFPFDPVQYILTIDLGTSPRTFEIGDTDGNSPNDYVFNNLSGPFQGGDEDGDDLADFGISLCWTGSGEIINWDEGMVTGPGLTAPNPPGPVQCPASRGVEDRLDLYANSPPGAGPNKLLYAGSFWFGGGWPFSGNAYASNMFRLFGPNGCPCLADWNIDGIVDIFDVLDFLDDFSNGNPIADLTGDTILDIFDVLDFLDAFERGC